MDKLKNIKVEFVVYEKIKKYCKENGLKMYYWVTQVLLEKLKEESKNDNIQDN